MDSTFKLYVDMTNINNSMVLDSGTEVARMTRKMPNGTIYVATLEIRGDVKVDYDGCRYRCASNMPKELLYMLNNWDEKYASDVDVDMNNWPEVFLWTFENGKLVWTGYSDVADAEGMNEEEIKNMLSEYICDCLGYPIQQV